MSAPRRDPAASARRGNLPGGGPSPAAGVNSAGHGARRARGAHPAVADSKPRRVPLFAARAPREVHARLRAAATEDGLTIADELTRLLDLRQRVTEVSRPRHPLARTVPVEAVVPDLRLVHGISADPVESPVTQPIPPTAGQRLNPVNWQPYSSTPTTTTEGNHP